MMRIKNLKLTKIVSTPKKFSLPKATFFLQAQRKTPVCFAHSIHTSLGQGV